MIFSILDPDSHPSNPLERRFYKGLGGQQQAAQAAAPRAFAPVTERLSDFSAVEREEKKKAAKRKGIGSTILAGESGAGFGGTVNTNFGQKTLLGA